MSLHNRNNLIALMLAAAAMLLFAAPASAVFEIESFDGGTYLPGGAPATRAGSHPHSGATEFHTNVIVNPQGVAMPAEIFRGIFVDLPPGLVGNPQAVKTCTHVEVGILHGLGCPAESQVGLATIVSEAGGVPGSPVLETYPLYNMKAPPGTSALLAFNIHQANVTYISTRIRTGGDYGISAASVNAPIPLPLSGVRIEIWGVPADPSHDTMRHACMSVAGAPNGNSCPSADAADPKAFFTLPTSCAGPARTDIRINTWEGSEDTSSFLSHDGGEPPVPIPFDECGALEFAPTLEARPTTNVADSPTGLDVDLHIPQDAITDPEGTAEAHLKDTTVTLPEGLVINPSGANGLGGCSSAQVDLHGEGPASCPEASKVGTVEVDTPLLDHPVEGAAYVATPHDNPFDSLLAIYIAVNDPQSGTVVKLAGEVTPDPATGRLTATFNDNPQLPFEDFKLKFFAGARAALTTPPVCGTYTTTSSLTPWSAPESGPPATPFDSWQITQGPGGGCATSEAALLNSPFFDAGTVSPIAGHYSSFVVNLRREDGSQRFRAIGLEPPQGLLAKLANTTRCSEAALSAAAAKSGQQEKSSSSCPAFSHVGTVVAGAGSGPAPYYASGEAYLAGPYKGAPISLAIVTPATAGPFDLGTIVVRTALHVNPVTAQIDAISDPVPHILQGIPLDVRSVQVKLDRPDFTLNPTSCDPMAVKAQVLSTLGQIASLQSPFQLAECTRLGFKPKMTMRLKGGSKRGQHPALTVTLQARPGDANLANISVALPRSEFLDQAHIGTVCTRVQWAADACPPASVYGSVSVATPLLDQPLTGSVYLRSSDNLLPDLVPDLRGPADLPIRFEAAGRTDSIKGAIRNTFDFVPDAPFTKLVVKLKGASKGLLINSRDICSKTYRATVKYGAHNGLALTDHPPLQIKCSGKAKKKHRAHRAQPRAVR